MGSKAPPPQKFLERLLNVVKLLPEADIDGDNANITVKYGGNEYKWGAMVSDGSDPHGILISAKHPYVPTDSDFDKASTEEKQNLMRAAFGKADNLNVPNNSLVRERLHALAYKLALSLIHI